MTRDLVQDPAFARPRTPPRGLALGACWVVLAVAYYLAAKLGLSLALVNASASVVWPPTGISIAAVLLYGPRVWPGIFLGALVANATTSGAWTTSLAIAGGNTIEGLVGGFLVARFAGGQRVLEHAVDVFRFALLAGVVSPLASATIGVASLVAGGLAPGQVEGVWTTWWLGDLVGAWVVAPFLLAWARATEPWDRTRSAEALLLLLCLALAAWLAFFGQSGLTGARFLCLALLVWAAFRFPQRTVTTAIVFVATLAIAGTLHKVREASLLEQNEELLLLQAFLGVTAITSIAVCAVVSEYRAVEAALRERTRALRRSNADLEQFATVASHDLQEPLRMVSSYVHLLERRYRGRLDPEADGYIRHAVQGAERMRDLIDGLLAYAQLDTSSRVFVRFESAVALKSALDNVEVALRESGTAVEHGELPTVFGDQAQLVQLFQNLIGNAIKFRRPGVAAQIRIASTPEGRLQHFTVSDNGIGMDPQGAERVFQAFQRLHHNDDYPGVGIGLTICKRIVERHGGRIWVDSIPGEGSTFHFTLPTERNGAAPARRA